MSKKSREIEQHKRKFTKAEKEKRFGIINSCYKCTIKDQRTTKKLNWYEK